jgi:hypothetical protein
MQDGLITIAQILGLEIKPAEKRGEVIITFPRPGREPFHLKLSRVKASELILWLYLHYQPKGGQQ